MDMNERDSLIKTLADRFARHMQRHEGLDWHTVQARLLASPDKLLALQAMVFLGSTPIGGPILGWVCEAFGARWGILLGAASCLAAGAWGLMMVRRCQAVPAVLTPPEAVAVEVETAYEMGGSAHGAASTDPRVGRQDPPASPG